MQQTDTLYGGYENYRATSGVWYSFLNKYLFFAVCNANNDDDRGIPSDLTLMHSLTHSLANCIHCKQTYSKHNKLQLFQKNNSQREKKLNEQTN